MTRLISSHGRVLLHSTLLLCVWVGAASQARPDWPQWGGRHRDFKADTPGLADSWPEDGPRRLWARALGDGYSAIVVADDVLYTMYRKDDHEFVIALEAGSGKTRWQHRYPAPFLPDTDLGPGPGPHATPLIVGDRICTVGVTGILHCLDINTGKVLWKHPLLEEFAATVLFRGYSSSPLAYNDSVIVTVGGTGHAVVAFRVGDGTVKWQKQDFQVSHASPLLTRFKGQDQLVVFAGEVIAGLDPRDGELLWQSPHPLSGNHVASMPVSAEGGRLFFSSAYGGGSRCIELTQSGNETVATEAWHTSRMRVHHSNTIRVGDHVYGSSGDFGSVIFTALDLQTGTTSWQDRRLGRSACVYADGKLIALEEDGHLSLATVSPAGLEVHSKVRLFNGKAWTPPSLVGKNLYIRNRKEIMAFELP